MLSSTGVLLEFFRLCCMWHLSRRLASRSSGSPRDVIIIFTFIGLRNKHYVYTRACQSLLTLQSDRVLQIFFVVVIGACAILMVLCIFRGAQGLSVASSAHSWTSQKSFQLTRLFPCRTTHTRLFPKTHSFSYSYLYAGVPIVFEEAIHSLPSRDGWISRQVCNVWFSVHANDYLQRTAFDQTLSQKLRGYLDSVNESFGQYPYVYLVTAPRFLGFSFNPVSFWYLYSRQKHLTAMILEVNNTFDERRMYFMKADMLVESSSAQGVFRHSFGKDFHVSPFNGRDGRYTLKARDPLASESLGCGWIDNTITLSSIEGKPKIVARVFSTESSAVEGHMNFLSTLQFAYAWWWVGFMTNARILREAGKLWMKNLQVFYRPEVLASSIGRRATAEEDVLAENFLAFLRYVQRHSTNGLSFRYIPAAGGGRACSINIPSGCGPTSHASDSSSTCNIHVLTPAFYSTFARYHNATDAIHQLCLGDDASQRLAVLSKPDILLPQIRATDSVQVLPTGSELLLLCRTLQAARQSSAYCCVALFPWKISRWFESFRPSQLRQLNNLADVAAFTAGDSSSGGRTQYFQTIILILLAKHFALGNTALLHLYRKLLRCALLCLIATSFEAIVSFLGKPGMN